MRLEGRVAVITGAGSGIGRAAALLCAQEGARVVVAEIDAPGGAETVAQVQESGGEALFVQTDVGEFPQVAAAVARAVETWGRLDIMVNNAGIGFFKPLLEHTPEEYDRVIKINQYGVYYGILAAARAMRDRSAPGVIINVASVFAYLADPGVISYHAAKAAVTMMTSAAALELAPLGIRVVGVAPGVVDTPIIQGYRDAGVIDRMARRQMRRRLLQPEQIARVIVFLASDEADAVNGSTVLVDDGYAAFK